MLNLSEIDDIDEQKIINLKKTIFNVNSLLFIV